MDAAAEVYEKSGLRGCLSVSTMDEAGLQESISMNARQAVKETDRLYDTWNGKGNLKVYYALRALNSCSDELVELAVSHSRGKKRNVSGSYERISGRGRRDHKKRRNPSL